MVAITHPHFTPMDPDVHRGWQVLPHPFDRLRTGKGEGRYFSNSPTVTYF